MSPTGGESGFRNFELYIDLGIWNRQTKLGIIFDSSTMFQLPSGSFRSPDVSWIGLNRWNALKDEQKKTFPPIVPDFVVELRSPSDSLADLRKKMQEYIDNGALLGWLLDPIRKIVKIYRFGQPTEVLEKPTHLSGENVLPGFLISLEGILY